jgi:hypothetical protein
MSTPKSESTYKLPLGQVLASSHTINVIPHKEMFQSLARHLKGDWGELNCEEKQKNEYALLHGGQLLSTYYSHKGVKFHLLTNADRYITTVLLPNEL